MRLDMPSATNDGLIFGVIQPWKAAVMVSMLASGLNVFGFVMQKMALGSADAKRWPRLGEVVFSPLWLIGFLFAVLAPLPGDLVAYAIAPMSLTAPLSGFTVVLNTIVAPVLLGERIQPWPDLWALALIVLGTILSTCTGDHQDRFVTFDLGQVLRLGEDPAFVFAFVTLIVLLWSCFAYMTHQKHSIEKGSRERPTNPPMLDVVLPAFLAAGAGCLSNIALKVMGELLKAHAPVSECAFCLICGVGPFACLQLNYVNCGLRLYFQTIFFPTYSALLVLSNTVYGAIFFQEYAELLEDPLRSFAFCAGVACSVAGISLFRFREPELKARSETCNGKQATASADPISADIRQVSDGLAEKAAPEVGWRGQHKDVFFEGMVDHRVGIDSLKRELLPPGSAAEAPVAATWSDPDNVPSGAVRFDSPPRRYNYRLAGRMISSPDGRESRFQTLITP